MKVALIAPRKLLPLTQLGDMHFIIPANKSVFFIPEVKYKMMDNGTYESGQPLPIEEFLATAHQLKVDEIVLPDVIQKRLETTQLTLIFISTVTKEFKYAAVPQGNNPLEWIECYKEFAKVDEIDVLCIPIWLQKKFGCRPAVVHKLLKDREWAFNKTHHLIGLDGYGELYNYPIELIRSVDTSLPLSRAVACLNLPMEDSRLSRIRFDLETWTIPQVFYDSAKRNIEKLLEVAHEYA